MKNHTIASYISFIPVVLAIVSIIFGEATKGFNDGTFAVSIVIALLAAIVLAVITFLCDLDFLPIITTAAYALVFGLTAAKAAPTLSDFFNGVNFMGGNLSNCITYLVLTGIAMVISMILLFFPTRQNGKT